MAKSSGSRVVKVEKVGGFAGFGSGSHLSSVGELDLDSLSKGERESVERLMCTHRDASETSRSPDSFRYRLSWQERGHDKMVEIGESEAPRSVRDTPKDELI